MSERIIRASEIAEYLFCRRAWWLSRVAQYEVEESEALTSGSAYHHQHGGLVWRARAARWMAYLLVFLAVAVFAYLIVAGAGS